MLTKTSKMNSSKFFKIFILFFLMNLSNVSIADYYEDLAKNNRSALTMKMCGASAEIYSNYAKWASDYLQVIYAKSKPNSKERDKLIAEFNELKRVKDDEDYLQRKKFADVFRDDGAARVELVYQLLSYSHSIAYSIAVENIGLSKIGYQRKIEEDCKYAASK